MRCEKSRFLISVISVVVARKILREGIAFSFPPSIRRPFFAFSFPSRFSVVPSPFPALPSPPYQQAQGLTKRCKLPSGSGRSRNAERFCAISLFSAIKIAHSARTQ